MGRNHTYHPAPEDVSGLALAFSAQVREHLAGSLPEIRRRNATPEYAGTKSCATHDFCDANMLMLEAFTTTFGREPRFLDGTDAQGFYTPEQWVDLHLWNDAWDLAGDTGFGEY